MLKHACLCMRLSPGAESWPWELGRGRRTIRVPVQGPVLTNSIPLMQSLAVSGVGLIYSLEDVIADHLSAGRLRVVLESYAPDLPGLFLYYPSGAQISPALKAFAQVARTSFSSRPMRKA